ncbi:MAG TPA: aspartate/glutamate racemase family protein [Mycobacteriales bacterium]|nr:aspartate/glutamate racemase family protein [Mycobacteriales bacterium]
MTINPIGILSGLGPLAGEDVLAKALDYAATRYGAVEDVDYPDVVLVSHGIENFDMTGDVSHGLRHELSVLVAELDSHHPSVIGVACNTAHLFLDDLREHSRAPIVDLIDEVAATAARSGEEYLLLSSSTTRATGLYRCALERHAVRFHEVGAHEQLAIDEIVHLVMAHELDIAGKVIRDFVSAWRSAPYTAVIAGCTELPMAIAHSGLARRLHIIDSNQVLAEALVDTYYFKHARPGALPALVGVGNSGA